LSVVAFTGAFSGQQEVQRQHRILGIEFEAVVDRIDEGDLLAVGLGKGEEVVLLQRLDVDLGQRLQLLAS
jgi:hypothetical protein